MQNSKPILLIEDDDVDVMTVKRALKDLKVTNELVPMGDGEEAIEYLKSEGAVKPCIVLLDLNMPKMDGTEFLKIVKEDSALKKIPISPTRQCLKKLNAYAFLTTLTRHYSMIAAVKLFAWCNRW